MESFFVMEKGNALAEGLIFGAISKLKDHQVQRSKFKHQSFNYLMLRLENYSWHHTNTWGYDHTLRCKCAVTHHIWIEADCHFVRVVKVEFNTLQLHAGNDLWAPLGHNLGGHPKILCTNEGNVLNRLAVEEKRFENRDAAVLNFVQFYEEKDMDFSEFCNEIFGDG